MFLNISLKSCSKWRFIAFIITVILFLIAIISMVTFIGSIQNKDKLEGNVDLGFTNYYVQYDMTVISNKNINTYNVKEWHKEGVITKLEYLDYMKNVVTIILENNTCNISNSGNTAKLVINNMFENKSISSLSTFGYLYNSGCEPNCCSKTQYVKEGETVVTLSFKQGCTCACSKIADELGISSLELILIDNKPKNYTVYNKNKKEYISIVYNVYEKNIEI